MSLNTQNDFVNNASIIDAQRLEAVITCVGFDDILDVTLTNNHPHFDTMIVVTSHQDKKTQSVVRKHGAILVQSDLFYKNGRNFNKGAAINAGFNHFQYHGWRVHMDADIAVPDNFRRMIFNHTHLDQDSIYGADRIDIIGKKEWYEVLNHVNPQHHHGILLGTKHHRSISHRLVSNLYGYLPIGYFQMWHAKCQKPYPYSLGTAAHDDMMFAMEWPSDRRVLLPTTVLYHLCSKEPVIGENWDGKRKMPKFK